jgi:hypothetical protein
MIQDHYLPEDLETVSDELEKLQKVATLMLTDGTKAVIENKHLYIAQIESSFFLLGMLNDKKEAKAENIRRNCF